MMGSEKRGEGKLFYYGFSLEKRVPKDHILRRVSEAIDFGFVRRSVAHTYGHNGHESEDPIVILKLMFLLFFEDVKSERELLRMLPMRLDWLWFLNLDLDSEIPHHSVLSKARARWGREVFEQLFVGVVRQCVEAQLVEGSKIHLDASLVAANVSRDSVVREPLRRVYQEQEKKLTRIEVQGKRKWVSRTDPEAVVVKKGKGDRPRPRYKNHRAVDDRQGVITAVETTWADRSEPHEVEGLIDQHECSTGKPVGTVVGDHQYGTNENYRACVKRGIRCHLGDVQSSRGEQKAKRFCREDFDYEAGSDRYRCPAGHYLKRYRTKQLEAEGFADYRMPGKRCQSCALKPQCTTSKHARRLKVPLELEWVELGRAQSLSAPAYQDRRRRKHLMERSFGDATNCHHFKQARWRGLQKQSIQDLLIAVCQNVRILCRHRLFPLAQQGYGSTRTQSSRMGALQQWLGGLYRLFWPPQGGQLSKITSIRFRDDTNLGLVQ
jgi:transposase